MTVSDAPTAGDVPFRILPRLTDRNRHFWQGGKDGELRFQQCNQCRYLIHPPGVLCPKCHSKDLGVTAVSGRAEILTYSVNHQEWMPGPAVPFVVAIVGIAEQDDVRLTTNIVDVDPDDVRIGMPVQVTFEAHVDEADAGEGVWLPLFAPAERG